MEPRQNGFGPSVSRGAEARNPDCNANGGTKVPPFAIDRRAACDDARVGRKPTLRSLKAVSCWRSGDASGSDATTTDSSDTKDISGATTSTTTAAKETSSTSAARDGRRRCGRP